MPFHASTQQIMGLVISRFPASFYKSALQGRRVPYTDRHTGLMLALVPVLKGKRPALKHPALCKGI